ncbi:hypothetical protein NQ314_014482 [Rhamnusium bicolor]|uniref:Uncharacterized protein n=1 Tax=Rhamnusium bicolor TaxID=1586634 RepID=A0AAV8X222_9CUCU|nr:hypothetical protein NQ314_014482 [Rhamnusium bicolor]
MAEKPKASSTPKIVDVSARRRIGDANDESVQSPIQNFIILESSHGRCKPLDSNSEDEKSESYIDSNDETEESKEEENSINTTLCNCINPVSIITMIVVFISLIFLYSYGDGVNMKEPSLEKLSQEFPSQVEDFWMYVEVGIQEITKFHQPKTFLLLYNDESQKTVNKILDKISQFAVCKLTNCLSIPVVLEGNDLNTSDILEDYGRIISRNKEKLKKSGVMIVKNLEKIRGISAQAFHSFCDEYNPVVEKALFIFTMKVDEFHENNVKFVENYLHRLWKDDIKDDKFYPLFTRISNNVLPVIVER